MSLKCDIKNDKSKAVKTVIMIFSKPISVTVASLNEPTTEKIRPERDQAQDRLLHMLPEAHTYFQTPGC